MTRHRGGRARRSGPTRQAEAWIRSIQAEPLPTDRAEAEVEKAWRSWAIARAKDQRNPNHKRQLHQAHVRYERVAVFHLERAHGVTLTRTTWGSWANEAGEYASPDRVHADLHPEA